MPLLSWFWLGGRCRDCRRPIPRRYPAVEAACALLFAWAALASPLSLRLAGGWVFLSFLVLLAAADLQWRLLPHPFTNGFLLSGLVFGLLSESSGGGGDGLTAAAGGTLAAGGALFLMQAVHPRGMGGGDVKMAAGLGAWLGPGGAFTALLAAFLAGGAFALILLASARAHRRSALPFGPFLAAGGAVAWFREWIPLPGDTPWR